MKFLFYTIIIILFSSITQVKGQSIKEIGFYNINGNEAMGAKSNIMMLGRRGQVVDISNPSLPQHFNSQYPCPWAVPNTYYLKHNAKSLIVSDDVVFFGLDGEASLSIVDISDPFCPSVISTLKFPETTLVYSMAKKDSILYMVNSSRLIYSVDVSNINHPIILDSLRTEWVFDIALGSDFAYLSGFNNGLQIIDISDPSNLKLISSIGNNYYSIAIKDSLAFLGSDGSGGIDVFNISNPFNPYLKYKIPSSNEGQNWDLKVHNNYIYAATNSKGLFIYKIENDKASKKLNYHKVDNGQCYSVCIQDSLVLLSTLIEGISILKFDTTTVVNSDLIENNNQIFLSPNPSNDFIKLNNLTTGKNIIEIIDMNGTLIKSLKNNLGNESIDISNLINGQYILRIESKEKVVMEKFIKVE